MNLSPISNNNVAFVFVQDGQGRFVAVRRGEYLGVPCQERVADPFEGGLGFQDEYLRGLVLLKNFQKLFSRSVVSYGLQRLYKVMPNQKGPWGFTNPDGSIKVEEATFIFVAFRSVEVTWINEDDNLVLVDLDHSAELMLDFTLLDIAKTIPRLTSNTVSRQELMSV